MKTHIHEYLAYTFPLLESNNVCPSPPAICTTVVLAGRLVTSLGANSHLTPWKNIAKIWPKYGRGGGETDKKAPCEVRV